MSDETKYKPALEWFAAKMERKLALPKNVGKEHWTEMPLFELFFRIEDETKELLGALQDFTADPDQAISECCDVANFAMMVADWIRNRPFYEERSTEQ